MVSLLTIAARKGGEHYQAVACPSALSVFMSLRQGKGRKIMQIKILLAGLLVAFGLSMNAAAQTTAAQQGAPTVKTGAALKAKAAAPAPSATAKNQSQKTSVGKGKATAKASAPSAYWTEEVDVHDDGSVETTEFL